MLLALLQSSAEAFAIGNDRGNARICHPLAQSAQLEDALAEGGIQSLPSGDGISIGSYRHKDFELTYLYKEAAPGREGDRPIILIHPVGIGLSSWFWEKLMESYSEDNPPIYAPDLIGCGLDHGADAWDPEEKGLFFPLSWVEGVETLINEIVIPKWEGTRPLLPLSRFLGDRADRSGEGGCLVIAQGGLAPVGIVLAERNPLQVRSLMLTSPPSYEDVTTPVPEGELRRNYDFLRSAVIGGLAFAALESRGVIEFFSNLFLFRDVCDKRWLDETLRESRYPEARTPVQAFNAGLLQHRSFERELRELTQPVLIVSGDSDKRVEGRQSYGTELKNCKLVTIEGCNVMPWENPDEVIELVKGLGF